MRNIFGLTKLKKTFYFVLILSTTKISTFPVLDDQIIFPDDERINDSADDLLLDQISLQNDPDILSSDISIEELNNNEEVSQNFENGEFFQGDIVLMEEQIEKLNKTEDIEEDNDNYDRTGRISESYRWPKNEKGKVIVPFVLSEIYTPTQSQYIQKAMRELEKHTCIEFIPQTREYDYIYIESYNGCFSNLGKTGGRQVVSLWDRGCMSRGIIMHELIHALGYTHMHNHEDRDKYIFIYWENILENRVQNFDKVVSTEFSNFGTPYDYKSVMHYGPTAFSKNRRRTIIPKLGGFRNIIGQREYLSVGDVRRINNMYECKK